MPINYSDIENITNKLDKFLSLIVNGKLLYILRGHRTRLCVMFVVLTRIYIIYIYITFRRIHFSVNSIFKILKFV